MALETVRFFTFDENDDALVGVTVRVFDDVGAFVTSQISSLVGSDAIADVTLNGDDPPVDYEIRTHKDGVTFDGSLGADSFSPMAIQVWTPAASSPTGTNDFDVSGQTFTNPVAVDPELCRVSGFVKDHEKNVVENYGMVITPWNPDETAPAAIRADDGNLIASAHKTVKSDTNGYVEFDLFRGSLYLARLQDQPDDPRELHVPDRGSIPLTDLLFPVIRTLSYTASPLDITVGETVDADPTITASDDRTFTPGDNVLVWEVADGAVAQVQIADNVLRVTGLAAGTTTITATLVDETIVRLPAEPQTLPVLTVNVT